MYLCKVWIDLKMKFERVTKQQKERKSSDVDRVLAGLLVSEVKQRSPFSVFCPFR